jgi:hypothetical protein
MTALQFTRSRQNFIQQFGLVPSLQAGSGLQIGSGDSDPNPTGSDETGLYLGPVNRVSLGALVPLNVFHPFFQAEFNIGTSHYQRDNWLNTRDFLGGQVQLGLAHFIRESVVGIDFTLGLGFQISHWMIAYSPDSPQTEHFSLSAGVALNLYQGLLRLAVQFDGLFQEESQHLGTAIICNLDPISLLFALLDIRPPPANEDRPRNRNDIPVPLAEDAPWCAGGDILNPWCRLRPSQRLGNPR